MKSAMLLLIIFSFVDSTIQSALQWPYANRTSVSSFTSTAEDVWTSPCTWEKETCWETCEPATKPCNTTQCLPSTSVLVPGTINVSSRCAKPSAPIPATTARCDEPQTMTTWVTRVTISTFTVSSNDCTQTGCTTIIETETVTMIVYTTSFVATTTLEFQDNAFNALMLTETCIPWTTTTTIYNTITSVTSLTSIVTLPGATVTVHSQVSYFLTSTMLDTKTEYATPSFIKASTRPAITFVQPIASALLPLPTPTKSKPFDQIPSSQIASLPTDPSPSRPTADPSFVEHFTFPSDDTTLPKTPNRIPTIPNHAPRPTPTIVVIESKTHQLSPSNPPPANIHPAPSGPGILLPNGQTLSPGHATRQGSLQISLPANTQLPYIFVNGRPVAKSDLERASNAISPVPGSALPTGDLSSLVDFHDSVPYVVTLPDGTSLAPGTSTQYNGHVLHLSSSGTSLSIDGQIVEKFYPVSTKDGSNDGTALWAVKIPGRDAGFVIVAPGEWWGKHRADVVIEHGAAAVVINGSSRVAFDTVAFTTALPSVLGVGGVGKGKVGETGGETGGQARSIMSVFDVPAKVSFGGGMDAVPTVGVQSRESTMLPSGGGEKGAASGLLPGSAKNRGVMMGFGILYALYI